MRWVGWLVLLTSTGFCESCKQQEVEGIRINGTLVEQQDFATNRRMRRLISQALHQDGNALAELMTLDCGGAAGCYDLGEVITQVLCATGEPEFRRMTAHFSRRQKHELQGFIEVGLEYGGYAVRKRRSNSIEEQFPDLYHQLQQ